MEECPHDEQRVLQLMVDRERSVSASSDSGQYVERMPAGVSGQSIASSALMKDLI
jgi:hypothetical protein